MPNNAFTVREPLTDEQAALIDDYKREVRRMSLLQRPGFSGHRNIDLRRADKLVRRMRDECEIMLELLAAEIMSIESTKVFPHGE